ncbi:MAG TPA: hypothetical protein VGQ00_03280 [Candidatus Norongarragalinales archaeon]|jgi:hypothetical protein|nr:hypothetical protein [Candidatus Norongarragalinales archaeon]
MEDAEEITEYTPEPEKELELTPEQRAAVEKITNALVHMGSQSLTPTFKPPADLEEKHRDAHGRLSFSASENTSVYSVKLPNDFFPENTPIAHTRAQLGLFFASKYGIDETLVFQQSSLPYMEKIDGEKFLAFHVSKEVHAKLVDSLNKK